MPVKSHRGEPGQVKSSPNRVSGDSIRLLRTVFVLYDLVDTWHLYSIVRLPCTRLSGIAAQPRRARSDERSIHAAELRGFLQYRRTSRSSM